MLRRLLRKRLPECVSCVLQAGEEVRLRSGTQTAAVKVSDVVHLDPPASCSIQPGSGGCFLVLCAAHHTDLSVSCRDKTDGHFVTGSWFVFSALALSLN